MKVALTGPVQLELIAPYFAKAGYGVAAPGEIPDITYDVTSHAKILAEEVPGFYDPRLEKLAGCPYSLAGIESIVEEFEWFLTSTHPNLQTSKHPNLQTPKPPNVQTPNPPNLQTPKLLAVDADNTLWHGILSEDGPDALVHCSEFQKGLKQLADDGVVLVLLSKNDPGSIENLAHRHSSFLILHSAFSSTRVNWEPKAGNLIEVCRELNLGLDSVVFVDDNPHERAQMKAHLPEVTVAPWNGWGRGEKVKKRGEGEEGNGEWGRGNGERGTGNEERQLIRRLREYFFSEVGKTDEDRLRAESYANQKRAEASLVKFATHDDYLRSLGLWVEARPAEPRDLDRLAQMAGKTNQFNCTTLRRPRTEFEAILSSPSPTTTPSPSSSPSPSPLFSPSPSPSPSPSSCFVFRAGDRFGEQGIVCYVIIDRTARRITDFVMSCRAMGRTLEHFAYEWIAQRVGYRPPVDFTPTAKNAPAKAFVEKVSSVSALKSYYTSI